ncbi:hypothetical protein [Saccharothrix sp. ALI-22-I]|nr:hypothetical protein [Saccharothrix sp. ALI-22-I]
MCHWWPKHAPDTGIDQVCLAEGQTFDTVFQADDVRVIRSVRF